MFQWLAGQMRAGNRWVILDLGPANAATIRYLNEFRCRLDIADMPAWLHRLSSDEEEDIDLRQRAESILPVRGEEPTDIVFSWDLFNYLDRPALKAVAERIAARARSGTFVHSLIVYSSSRMPVSPSMYYPGDDDYLNTLPVTTEERDAPRYTPDDLARCMPAYRVERAMLLNNGMQEFLFRL